jgi:hypothetical protein
MGVTMIGLRMANILAYYVLLMMQQGASMLSLVIERVLRKSLHFGRSILLSLGNRKRFM